MVEIERGSLKTWGGREGGACSFMTAASQLSWLQVSAAVTAYVAHGHRLERLGFAADHRPHSSSASRFTAGASGFLLLIQSGERPDLYRESFRFETMPSRPSLHA
jgi:hypothetical protein